jgi:phosphatidate cytidylyltransferase
VKKRVLTALVAIPLVLAVVGCTNPWPLAVMLICVGVVCGHELDRLFEITDWDAAAAVFLDFLVLIPLLLLLSTADLHGSGGWMFPIAALFFQAISFGPGLLLAISGQATPMRIRFLAGWIAYPLAALIALHRSPSEPGSIWVLASPLMMVLLPIWAGDTAAMLGGKAFGKHKLAPTISPNKTWEGAIANIIAAVAVGWAVGAWLGYETWVGLACGAAVGVFGQLGDLFESALKRAAGKKDSGTLLPGHGGVLDRIDALLGSVIPVWLILHFSGSLS